MVAVLAMFVSLPGCGVKLPAGGTYAVGAHRIWQLDRAKATVGCTTLFVHQR
jgi:hypothetical protein